MIAGIAALVLAYLLSQFYRAFLAVMAPALQADPGVSAADLATASGIWFLAFAAMQLPVGWALDRLGPRRTTSVLLAAGGGGGALWMAQASGATDVSIAMALIGIGCAPVLMASYYVFARSFPPAIFGTLAGAMVGIGSFGNIAASLPLAWAVEGLGWRGAMLGMAAITLTAAAVTALLLRDPPAPEGGARGSLRDLFAIPALWLILPMVAVNYMPAGALRGFWVGPYFADVFGEGPGGIGRVTLVMGLAMVAGNFAYGPLDRLFGTRKWVVFSGNAMAAACLLALWWLPPGWVAAAVLLAGVGLFGASFPMVMAHGRAFFPAHLVGRGVGFLNLLAIGTVGVAQFVTGRLHAAVPPDPPEAPYAVLFLAMALVLILGLIPYAFAKDRTD